MSTSAPPSSSRDMAIIEPYTIHVPDAELQSLHEKLEHANFPDELDGAGWDYGAPLADVKRLAAYWKNGFDWRKQEAEINKLPNYHTVIQIAGFEPLDIHFLHQRSADEENAIPLLFVHGWPGNFLEVTKILPLLTDPPAHAGSKGANTTSKKPPNFHVVAPSLPNFGFSSGTSKRGFGLEQHAEVCHQLMQRLGYTQYVTQGGDWGMYITRTMSVLYPSAVKATHLNMVRAGPPTLWSHPLQYLRHLLGPTTERERAGAARTAWFRSQGSGYSIEQATKPQTLGYSLSDSPVGLLAWIYEKLHDWTDSHPWTPDEILTWVSIYRHARAGPAASVRIYYESTHPTPEPRQRTERYMDTSAKLGLSYFPRELTVVPQSWGRTMGNVVFEAVHDRGGHFAAWEQPRLLVEDLWTMFGPGGGAHGCCPAVPAWRDMAVPVRARL